jgi:hypothetical protein
MLVLLFFVLLQLDVIITNLLQHKPNKLQELPTKKIHAMDEIKDR